MIDETMQPPVFVVGVGRSGTSLVQSMLAAHPSLAFPPESAFVRRYVAKGIVRRTERSGGPEAVVELLSSDDRIRRFEVGVRELVDAAASYGALTDANVYRSILRLHARRQGVQRAGDKDPRLIEYLELLHRLFPDAWVVHVIRDPRDVLASKKSAAWSRDYPILRHVFANRVQLTLGRRDGRRWFGERYVELLYEDLLSDPDVALRDLCEAIALPYDSSMLDFNAAAARIVSPEEMAWKSETLGPLLTDNRGKWRDTLSAWETGVTERVCREAMQIGGYTTGRPDERLGLVGRAAVRLTAWILGAADPLYRAARSRRTALIRI